MKLSRVSFLATLLAGVCAISPGLLADTLYVGHKPEHHILKSKNVDQSYEVTVLQPISKPDGSERFPVLYAPDGDYFRSIAEGTAQLMQGADVRRFIVVTIGYPEVEYGLQSDVLRQRDLTPTRMMERENRPLLPIEGVVDIKSGKKSGGAREFLAFIREELMPFIDGKYPTLPDDRAYFGDSYGGLFGLYVLFNQPDSFQRYIIGSPSIWYDNEVILKQAHVYIDSGKPINAKVFIAGGDQEGNSPEYNMVTNFYRLHGLLSSAKIPGLELSFHIFPGETHSTVPALNYIRGVREIYGKPQCPLFYPGDDKNCK